MMDWRIRNLIRDFKESRKGVGILLILHLLLVLASFCFGQLDFFTNRHIALYLTVALLTFGYLYKWDNLAVSLVILLTYFSLILFEYLVAGMPIFIDVNASSDYVSKGVLMQIILAVSPYLYFPLRIAFSMFLLYAIYLQQKLSTANVSFSS